MPVLLISFILLFVLGLSMAVYILFAVIEFNKLQGELELVMIQRNKIKKE